MAKEDIKKVSFEYVLYKLNEWYFETHRSDDATNDISTLKALKLLFFISAVDTNNNSGNNTLLDSPFNKFVAMPYGHVESDIYNIIRNDSLENSKITNSNCEIKNLDAILQLDISIRTKIDNSIEKLKKINKNLINFSSFQLVELSHRWFSWQKNYLKAQKLNQFSLPIDINEIKSEDKFYQI